MEKQGKLLRVQGLSKKFGTFQAVNNVSLKMYEGEIFALLGHNGAGKTTSISMLTGMLTRDQGEGLLYDWDLFDDAHDVRNNMGVCP